VPRTTVLLKSLPKTLVVLMLTLRQLEAASKHLGRFLVNPPRCWGKEKVTLLLVLLFRSSDVKQHQPRRESARWLTSTTQPTTMKIGRRWTTTTRTPMKKADPVQVLRLGSRRTRRSRSLKVLGRRLQNVAGRNLVLKLELREVIS
jgi:hypothetical protein